MSQANWIEWFRDQPVELERPKPLWQRLPNWVLNWEGWLTFVLVTITFLSVAQSIQSAHWVEGMPSLAVVSFLALLTGFAFARIRVNEVFLHLLALLTSVPVVVGFSLSYMGETSLLSGLNHFWYRFGDWIDVIRTGGITSDNMPFVTVVLALTWVAAYLSSWAIFRWRNVWFALIPGGIGLLTNISYLPGQFSTTFVIFLFGSILLVMRVNLLNHVREWDRRDIAVPRLLSLSLLNATVWIAASLLIIAWWVPLASESHAIASLWNGATSPVGNASADWTRLLSSIDAKHEVPLHSFGPTLPLQGKVVLSNRVVAEVDFQDQSNAGHNLVATRYDEYTAAGWKRGARDTADLGPTGVHTGDATAANDQNSYHERKTIPTDVIVDSPNGVLLSLGAPVQASIDTHADIVSTAPVVDVTALHPKHDLKRGDQYTTLGSISNASEAELRASGSDYPEYVRSRYLQLPAELPQRVRDEAQRITTGESDPYSKARQIEDLLRGYPNTYDIPIVPPGRDATDFFLFDTRRGYSDHQASAMVVLLRAAGVPARLATGYAVQEYDQNSHLFVIREKDAESWPEVYFTGYGWVEFSPFGGAPYVARPDTGGGDAVSPGVDDPIIRGGGPALYPGESSVDFPLGDPGIGGSYKVQHPFNWLPVYIALTTLAILLLMGGFLRLAWEHGLRGLDYPSRTWEKTQRLASWLRVGPRASQTPSEFAQQLEQRTQLTDPRYIADGYLRSRYGHKELSTAEQTGLDKSWVRLRNRLVKRLLRIK